MQIDGSVISDLNGQCPPPTYRCTAQPRYKSEDNFTAAMKKRKQSAAREPAAPQTSRPDYLKKRAMGQRAV
jgi:hypothetical protein